MMPRLSVRGKPSRKEKGFKPQLETLEDRLLLTCEVSPSSFDHNDTIAEAISIGRGATTNGSIGDGVAYCLFETEFGQIRENQYENDVDFYSVSSLGYGEVLKTRANVRPPNFNFAIGVLIRVFDSAGMQVAEANCESLEYFDPVFGSTVGGSCLGDGAQTSYTVRTPGSYFVAVSDYLNSNYDPQVEHSGTLTNNDFEWRLSVDVTPLSRLTVITHGFQPTGNRPDWIIGNRSGVSSMN